jgi:hypothetical protein
MEVVVEEEDGQVQLVILLVVDDGIIKYFKKKLKLCIRE